MAGKGHIYVNVGDVCEALSHLRMDNPQTRTLAERIIRGEVVSAKMTIQQAAKKVIGSGYKNSHGDIREAWRALVANIWKSRGLGGSIALQHSSYNTETKPWQPERKGTRGKRSRSGRTDQLDEYFGRSRGFILRWLNNGTAKRVTGGRNKRSRGVIRITRRPESGTPAYRGRIKGKHWFQDIANPVAQRAAQNIGERITSALSDQFNKP